MKTIKQQVEVNFNCVTLQDAIVILPLMNYLKRQAELEATEVAYKQLSREDRDKYKWVPSPEIADAALFYNKLREFGFCASDDSPITPHLENYKKKE